MGIWLQLQITQEVNNIKVILSHLRTQYRRINIIIVEFGILSRGTPDHYLKEIYVKLLRLLVGHCFTLIKRWKVYYMLLLCVGFEDVYRN